MRRSLYLIILLLPLTAMALACGGGGGGGERSEVSPTAEATGSPESTVTSEAEVTPGVTATVELSPTVTGVPGARLVMPEDLEAFLAQFTDDVPTTVSCDYDDGMALVDCTEAGHGKFELVPPVSGTVELCGAGILDDKVIWVRCLTELSVFFYAVAGE